MMDEGFGYQLPTGDFAIEGFVFCLKGHEGELHVTPQRLLAPPVKCRDDNWITLAVAISGNGVHGERFHGELVMLDGPVAVLSTFESEIAVLLDGKSDVLEFPSPRLVEFSTSYVNCRIARDRNSRTGLAMVFRCASPSWWSDNDPPTQNLHEHTHFAADLSVLMSVDVESLEVTREAINAFLSWLEREASSRE